ncbi:MAG: serine/threonine protein kinase [Planctomycetes bacterium]|nr:serine/threonine protein kinase [Planctomycetota bacterium]
MGETPSRTIWGDFEIHFDQLLGHGGMGSVYRARQLSLDRWVAVKIVEPGRAPTDELAAGFFEKFEVEAKALARLRDSRIVTILQAGRAGGTCWYAMELVDGETVEQRLDREGAFESREAARIAAEVARGLSAALVQGIIHRDVKPANIFLTSTGNVKLGDFGLARSQHFKPTRLTLMNAVAATPEYVSPEQASNGACDHRSDQYSLGAVLFEMVTERPPFEGATAMETMLKHLNEPPPDPSKLNPQVPPPLAAVILRCLEKERERRYPRYEDLIRDVEEAVHLRPSPAPSDRAAQHSRSAMGAAVFVSSLLLVLLAWTILKMGLEAKHASPAAFLPSPHGPSARPASLQSGAEDAFARRPAPTERMILELRDQGRPIEAFRAMREAGLNVDGVADAARAEAWAACARYDGATVRAYLEVEDDERLAEASAGIESPLDHPLTKIYQRKIDELYRNRSNVLLPIGGKGLWTEETRSPRARWGWDHGLQIRDPERETWISKHVGTVRGFAVRFQWGREALDASWAAVAISPRNAPSYEMLQVGMLGPQRVASVVERDGDRSNILGKIEIAAKDHHELAIVLAEGHLLAYVDGLIVWSGRRRGPEEWISVGVKRCAITVKNLWVAR